MKKEYTKIEFTVGDKLSEAIEILREHKEKNILVFGEFNGHKLYSDMEDIDDMDAIYKRVVGKTKKELDEEQKKYLENLKKEKEEHNNSIPEKILYYNKLGKEILDEEYHELWEKCVPIRLGDLYRGMELDCTLDIVKELNENGFEKAYEVLCNQGHSGMSHGLVVSMIRSFHKNGNEFAEFIKTK